MKEEKINMNKKELNKTTKVKKKYLTYFKKAKSEGRTPMTWAKWKQKHDSSKMGGSSQFKKQMGGLSTGDYNEIMKMMNKRKKK